MLFTNGLNLFICKNYYVFDIISTKPEWEVISCIGIEAIGWPAVIGGKHDDGVVVHSPGLQRLHELTNGVVQGCQHT